MDSFLIGIEKEYRSGTGLDVMISVPVSKDFERYPAILFTHPAATEELVSGTIYSP